MEYPPINATDLVQALTEQRDAAMNNAAQFKALLDAALKRERSRATPGAALVTQVAETPSLVQE